MLGYLHIWSLQRFCQLSDIGLNWRGTYAFLLGIQFKHFPMIFSADLRNKNEKDIQRCIRMRHGTNRELTIEYVATCRSCGSLTGFCGLVDSSNRRRISFSALEESPLYSRKRRTGKRTYSFTPYVPAPRNAIVYNGSLDFPFRDSNNGP